MSPQRSTVEATDPVAFRPLEFSDLPLLHLWVREPHVRQWYPEPQTLPELEAKYRPKIEGGEPTDPYLILVAGQPVGYIQTYRIEDHPDYARCVNLDERAAGVDLFIGEKDRIHRGLGTRVLRQFLHEIVFADPEIESCVLGPDPKNHASIRCYEKVGFRFVKQIQVPDEPEPEYLMRITRADLDQ